MINIDARKKDCPIPVIETKKALQKQETKTVVTLVDNQIAVENLLKMATQLGFLAKSTKISDECFQVVVSKKVEQNQADNQEQQNQTDNQNDDPTQQADQQTFQQSVVVFESEFMGKGDDVLGAALAKSFLYALAQSETLPKEIICYNGGVKLCCEQSTSLADLEIMQNRGVKIFSCGACLNFYKLSEKLRVGETTNMMEIIEKLQQATKIIKP